MFNRMLQMVWILLRNSAERSPINSRRKSFPPFDMAYQGFASADSKRDAKAIRIFLEDENLIGCAQSYAEKMGLYGQRVGYNTVDFIGHALALHKDDSYLDEPAIDTVKRMKFLREFVLVLEPVIVVNPVIAVCHFITGCCNRTGRILCPLVML
ncbi:hypothetical protein MRB53_026266 [Persea americana]|uniref:Uncharacterized protein n=1 Tax=Persea americana TaxID=3435 RepID=A0ACC2LI26_PERAE|nr:hypothetical protein MRB53_026266 [Persea americana]